MEQMHYRQRYTLQNNHKMHTTPHIYPYWVITIPKYMKM